ncbi:class I adenylate-forming enzyme family protein [Paenibacillus sp. FSL P2-0089]|uniref:class I adenylate-forming enzyme family protein n=1 Tax=Paenibacillus sp. FSL P2-0089 TaxID=2954526 RepID=UPI003159B587
MTFSFLHSHACNRPDHTAIKYQGKEWTYRSLIQEITRVMNDMADKGIGRTDKILLYLPNSIDFVVHYFASTGIGAIPVLADIKYQQEMKHIFAENQLKCIIGNGQSLEHLRQYIDLSDEIIIDVNSRLQPDATGFSPDSPEANALEVPSQDDIALILYTSGSTGYPKGIVNTYRTLNEALSNYLGTLPFTSDDIFVGVTPFFHSYAFGSCFLSCLAIGGTLLLYDTFIPRPILKAIEEEKATVFQGVPFMYHLLIQQLESRTYDLSSLRLCISAGAPIKEMEAAEFYKQTGHVIHQEYGSTETGTMAVNLSPDMKLNIESVGKPLFNVEIRITDEGSGEGQLFVRKKGHAYGYLNDAPFEDDWWPTGDFGKMDREGNIFILGRLKKMINVAGLKVNPQEVEAVLAAHPGVADVMVGGLLHPEFGEIVAAYLIPHPAANVTQEEIMQYCYEKLALYKAPRVVYFVNEIAKTSLGKSVQLNNERLISSSIKESELK